MAKSVSLIDLHAGVSLFLLITSPYVINTLDQLRILQQEPALICLCNFV